MVGNALTPQEEEAMAVTLTAEDLTKLADLVRKAGGIEELRQHIEALALPGRRHDPVRLPSNTSQLAWLVDAADDTHGC
jgi:hypothetical protein